MDGKTKYEHWALQFTFIYYGSTLFPFILFATGKKFYGKNNIVFIVINSFLCVILWIASFVVNFVTVNQSISFETENDSSFMDSSYILPIYLLCPSCDEYFDIKSINLQYINIECRCRCINNCPLTEFKKKQDIVSILLK